MKGGVQAEPGLAGSGQAALVRAPRRADGDTDGYIRASRLPSDLLCSKTYEFEVSPP